MKLNHSQLREVLDRYHDKYNRSEFIENDPICIPHQYTEKKDIEISGFLAATIAWGKREMIIKNAQAILNAMDLSPFDFIMNHSLKDLNAFDNIKHRTFNSIDLKYFIRSLSNIYKNHGGLESALSIKEKEEDTFQSIYRFHSIFFDLPNFPLRTKKHVSNPINGSAAKRLNMYYRWMARKDNRGVDFGIWETPPRKLICPLDLHTGNISRTLGLLDRKQNDWKAAKELSNKLKIFDPMDPIKYDYALFGAGINKDI